MWACLLAILVNSYAAADEPAPLPAEDRPFAARFADPPGSARILKIVHGWPLGAEAERAQIHHLVSQGFGGFATNVGPWNENYLESEAYWDQMRRIVAEAERLGLTLWLYDEMGYPSGTAGGRVLREQPDWAAEGLLVATATAAGPGSVEIDLPPGELLVALAAPPAGLAGSRDLWAQARDGKLTFTAPAAGWRVLAMTQDKIYDGTHAAMNVFVHQPYTNLLRPEPTRRFVELTHARYGRELGDPGRYFAATFTDEPSLMSAFIRPQPHGVLPWAENVAPEFARRRGYDLLPHLAALALTDGGAEAKVRYDFWQTVTELLAENYFGQVQEAAHAIGLPAGGHLIWEEGLRAHVMFYGSAMACARYLSAPSIDCLTSLPGQVPYGSARLLASVAELEGRELVMSETSDHSQVYRPEGDTRPPVTVTADHIRGTLGRQMVGGVNTFTSYYTFRDLDDAALRELNTYTGRLTTSLRGGHQVTDIAVVYPIESLWPHTIPPRGVTSPDAASAAIEEAYTGAVDAVFSAGRDACIIDAQALAEARVDGPLLRHGDLAWSVLVLPGVETLPEAAWATVAEFWRRGGAVVALSRRPANTAVRFPDPLVADLAEAILGPSQPALDGPRITAGPNGARGVWLPPGSELLLPTVLAQLTTRDVTAPAGAALRATHRRIDDHDVWLVLNDSDQAFAGEVRVAASGPGDLCNPVDGSITPITTSSPRVELAPYHAVILRYAAAAERPRQHPPAGPLALGTTVDLALRGAPEPGAGEHVRAAAAQATTSPDGRPAWRFAAEVTESQVDTFNFAQLVLQAATDLSATGGLRLEIGVPAGQTPPAILHAIVHTADGGQYLTSLGRATNDAGWRVSLLPWSRFARAGWATAGADQLDLRQVTQINVGWGGYLGTAGEQIEYTIAAPQVFQLAP